MMIGRNRRRWRRVAAAPAVAFPLRLGGSARPSRDDMMMRCRGVRFWLACLVVACIVPATMMAGFLVFTSYQRSRANLDRDTVGTARALMQAVDAELSGVQAA